MKIGVLGTGFGMVHLQTFSKHPLVDEVVFFSRTQQKVDELSAQMGFHGTTNLDDILCDSTVDVVTVALPPALHAEVATRAMEHGKDVICEIPVCPTLTEAERLADVSRRTGKRVLVNLFTRFGAVSTLLKEKAVSGEYGKLLSLQVVGRNAPVWGEHPLGLSVLPLESCYCEFDWLGWCLTLYDNEKKRTLAIPEVNAYYDSLTYSLERILDGKPGITNLLEAVPALSLALELENKR